MLFIRFLFCLALGLVGLSMVLLTVIETLFLDWDPTDDLRLVMKQPQMLRRLLAPPPRETADAFQLTPPLNAYGRPSRLPQPAEPALLAVDSADAL